MYLQALGLICSKTLQSFLTIVLKLYSSVENNPHTVASGKDLVAISVFYRFNLA